MQHADANPYDSGWDDEPSTLMPDDFSDEDASTRPGMRHRVSVLALGVATLLSVLAWVGLHLLLRLPHAPTS